ncbi:MAG: Hsp20/alpha crystallin family protein [Candidatus Lokiarchaeota archaeon]|nr:Hsp20/alpha crystallin family protein [Candidatus Lokiarchaeota archaeon]
MSEQIQVKKDKSKKKEKEEKEPREIAIRRDRPFSLFQEMDRYFDDMTRDLFGNFMWPFSSRRWGPSILSEMEKEPLFRTPLSNITEDDKNFNIVAEMPGLNKSDITVSIHDGNLEIKGEAKEEKREEKEGKLVRREYRSSSYYRCFSLPENANEDLVNATLDKGILKVTIPKKEPVKIEKKTIEVK